MSLLRREESLFDATSARVTAAASLSVIVLEAGAQVASPSSGTTATVRRGHGFASGDKLIQFRDGAPVASSYRTVSSTPTSTTIPLSSSLSLAINDYLVNLSADTGTLTPNFDGSGLAIYSTMDGAGSPISASTLQTNASGVFGYWHRGSTSIWEMVLLAGVPAGLIPDAFVPESGAAVERGVVYASAAATGGDGSITDPWTGWESVLTGAADGDHVHFPKRDDGPGYYLGSATVTADGLEITGDGPSSTIWQNSSASGDALKVNVGTATSATNITIRDVQFTQVTNALTSGKSIVNIFDVNRAVLDNVSIVANSSSDLTSSGTAIAITDINSAWVHNLHVRGLDATGVFAIGVDVCQGVSANRGNVSFFGGLVERCTTGARIAESASNQVNNIQFYGTKFLRNGTNPAASDGIGIDAYTQTFCLVVSGVHIEGYNNSARLAGVTGALFDACTITRFQEGATPRGVYFTSACNYCRVANSLLTNNSSVGTGIELDASAHAAMQIGPNFYNNIASPLTDGTNSSGELNIIWHVPGSQLYWIKDVGLQLGRGIDETISLTFDRASTDATIKWIEGSARFEINQETLVDGILRTNGSFIGAGRVDVGTFLRLPGSTVLTIASGVVTATLSNHRIAGEGGVADDLVTINGGGQDGQVLALRASSDSVTITVKHGTGNIFLNGAADFALDSNKDMLLLMYDGTQWVEIGRGNNGA